jgi:hypothetical protein
VHGKGQSSFFLQAPGVKPLFWRLCFMASIVYEFNTNIEHWSNDIDVGKTEVLKEKPFLNVHFFTTNSTQIQIYIML